MREVPPNHCWEPHRRLVEELPTSSRLAFSRSTSADMRALVASLANCHADRTDAASARVRASNVIRVRQHIRAQSHLQMAQANASPKSASAAPEGIDLDPSGSRLVGRMSGAVRFLGRPSGHQAEGRPVADFGEFGEYTRSPALAGPTKTAADLRKSGGQGRDRTGDLPLFRWKYLQDKPVHTGQTGQAGPASRRSVSGSETDGG